MSPSGAEAPLGGLVASFAALVAVSNVVPILPVVREFTESLSPREGTRYAIRALGAGTSVAVGFLLAAPFLFAALSLNLNDLRVAGGVVLLVYATHDILFSRATRKERNVPDDHEVGPAIAPLGIPILVGPATLSMIAVLGEVHGVAVVLLAIALNLGVNALILAAARPMLDLMGDGLSRAVGKVMSLLLATLGAGMLRAGIPTVFGG